MCWTMCSAARSRVANHQHTQRTELGFTCSVHITNGPTGAHELMTGTICITFGPVVGGTRYNLANLNIFYSKSINDGYT